MAGLLEGIGGFAEKASPLLLAMGQNMMAAPHQRDPRLMQIAMAQMTEQARAQRVRQMLGGGGGDPRGPGPQTPGFNPGAPVGGGGGLIEAMGLPPQMGAILSEMPPDQAMGVLAQMMTQQGDPYERYRVVGSDLVDMGAEGGPSPVYRGQPNMPDSFRGLELRAAAAGLMPGTPEYSRFIAAGGNPPDQYRPATPEEAAAIGATGGQVNQTTGEIKPAANREKPTGEERKAYGYAQRMEAAEQIIGELEADGRTSMSMMERAADRFLPEDWVLSSESLRLKQAQRDWVRSKLRWESGAVIGDEEADEEAKTYFPQPNDPPEVIAQKKQARATARDAMRAAAGTMYPSQGQPAAQTAPAQPPQGARPFAAPPEVAQSVGQLPDGTRIAGPDGREFVVFGGQLFGAE